VSPVTSFTRDAKFQTHSELFWNDDTKKDDGTADNEQRDAVADAPENSSERSTAYPALATNDGSDGDDVIGIGRVTHSEKKTENKDRPEMSS
jgi:hypothetical protein